MSGKENKRFSVGTFCRQGAKELLKKRVGAFCRQYRQNLALIGHQSLGKTTLIHDLLREFAEEKFIPIYIRLEGVKFSVFAEKFMGVLFYQLLKKERLALSDDLDLLLERAVGIVPKTVWAAKQIRKHYEKPEEMEEAYSLLLDLPQVLHDETGRQVLLILDEFQRLEEFPLKNPFLELSNKIMVQKYTMYVIVSSSLHNAHAILNEKLSLLFGNFESINLQPFDEDEAGEFCRDRMKGIRIPLDYLRFIINFSGGFPFYLDVISGKLKSLCLDLGRKEVDEAILLNALQDVLYKDYGTLNQFFHNQYNELLRRGNGSTVGVLEALAEGRRKPSAIAAYLNCTSKEVNRCLNLLVKNDFLVRKGALLQEVDLMFFNWIRYVLRQKRDSFNIDVDTAAKWFQNDIGGLLEGFMSESRKNPALRIKELFDLFDNELVEIENRRFKLMNFDEVSLQTAGDISLIEARKDNKHWVCGVGRYIDESGFNSFIGRLNGKKCLKKILICFDGIDDNIKLKAMDSRFWIWEKESLNELLSLFEKPWVFKC